MGFVRRPAFVTLAAGGWILIMVVAAGPRPPDRTWLGLPDVGGLENVIGVLIVALALPALMLALLIRRRRSSDRKSAGAGLVRTLVALAMAILLLLTFQEIMERLEVQQEAAGAEEETPDQLDEEAAPLDFEITSGQLYGTLLVMAGWLVVAALTVRRRPSIDDQAVEPDQPDLTAAVDDAINDLITETEPRIAVLAAYRRLEQTLAEQGHPRHPTETRVEHLSRILSTAPIDREPFLSLAALYERARYSNHAITAQDSERAATELAAARHQLTSAGSEP